MWVEYLAGDVFKVHSKTQTNEVRYNAGLRKAVCKCYSTRQPCDHERAVVEYVRKYDLQPILAK